MGLPLTLGRGRIPARRRHRAIAWRAACPTIIGACGQANRRRVIEPSSPFDSPSENADRTLTGSNTTQNRQTVTSPRTHEAESGLWLTMLRRQARAVAVAAAVVAALACDRGRATTKADSSESTDGEALAATAGVVRQGPAYTIRALDTFGRLTGTVEIDGPAPLDSVIQPSLDQTVCGVAFTRRGIERFGKRAIGVIVWIDGLRSGKPLPVERRFEIANDRCVLAPEAQTAIVGGTLNVQNLDATEHRTRITRRDGGEVVATIRQTDEGQVVPNEHVLSNPGVLHLSCDLHPWTHAWIAVFDHPYYVTTGRDGSFAIDSVPPGRYQLRAWHPRLGIVDDSVTIEPGKVVSVTLRAKATER